MSETLSSAPIITKEEIFKAEHDFKALTDRRAALFFSRLRFGQGFAEQIERAAAVILFNNLLLMQHSSHGVMKLAEITVTDPQISSFAFANASRGYLTGSFSTLSNFRLWVEILNREHTIPDDLIEAAERSIHFLESYSARQRIAIDETADFFIGFKGADGDEYHANFEATEPFYGALNIRCGDAEGVYLWSEYIKSGAAEVRYLNHSSHMLLSLDFERGGNVVEDWINALRGIHLFHEPAQS